jgi:lipopolysaccharide/colanic/teichoic acid biosynthesis glycosyltransferase
MVINSKEVLEKLLENDPEAKKEWDATFKLKNDPRITKIGDSFVELVWMNYLSYSMS